MAVKRLTDPRYRELVTINASAEAIMGVATLLLGFRVPEW